MKWATKYSKIDNLNYSDMQYSVATFQFSFPQEWQADLFAQNLFDLGFDTIDENKAYIPTALLETQKKTIIAQIEATEGVTLLSIEQCADENWNATWEAEHPIQELPLGVQIIPHCAFGAGHHETTSMMIEALLNTSLTDKCVLDHGTGTGVLAIFAKKLGAAEVVAVDIDDKSVINARENAALNNVSIDVRLADTPPDESFDLILANIHRNILLDNMPRYAACLNSNGQLWLSGFYESDCAALIESAQSYGLKKISTHQNGEWRMIVLLK